MSTMTETTPLTADDIKLLRTLASFKHKLVKPNAAVVRLDEKGVYTYEIVATRAPVEGAREEYGDVRFNFPASGTVHTYSAEDRVPFDGTPVAHVASESIYTFGKEGAANSLTSIANVAKPGDTLFIKFVIGNSTDNLKKADFQQDEAYVTVVRNNKWFATFPVDFRVVPRGQYGASMRSSR